MVLGNEVAGVEPSVLAVLDEVVEVPMFGFKNSLNVAAAAPVVMYEILRQMGITDRSKQKKQKLDKTPAQYNYSDKNANQSHVNC